jgi:long-chain fatty acid transport protein
MKKLLISAAVAATLAPAAWATNGMDMEGYGPIATAMGGASFAYDNGNAGAINNPATLALMAPGTSRLDLSLGGLHPDVSSQGQSSSSTSFFMPAIGYVRKDGNLAYGVGVVAQGGMGTDYSNSSAFGQLMGMNFTNGTPYAVGPKNLENKSVVGVGRVIFPLAFNVNDKFTIGGSVDFLWAGMDIRWLMDGVHFGDMMPGGSQHFGSVSGALVNNFGAGVAAGNFTSLDYGYVDFSKGSAMTQQATSTGWAGNLGFTYKVSPQLSVGGVYHAKSNLGDMKTGTNDATVSFAVSGAGAGAGMVIPLTGQATIRNFQWPETYGIGLSYQANDQWQFAADYKRINWSGVMQNFVMGFTVANVATNGNFQGNDLTMTYKQNWSDENVFMLGAAYKYSDPLTLRFGVNVANNPVPDGYASPLFPAIITKQFMGGFGYALDKQSSLDFSLVYAPRVTVTNSWATALGGAGTDQTISHSQTNWQVMYSKRF